MAVDLIVLDNDTRSHHVELLFGQSFISSRGEEDIPLYRAHIQSLFGSAENGNITMAVLFQLLLYLNKWQFHSVDGLLFFALSTPIQLVCPWHNWESNFSKLY